MTRTVKSLPAALKKVVKENLATSPGSHMGIDPSMIDMETVEIDAGTDYPDFSDAYIERANFLPQYFGGRELTDVELDQLQKQHSNWVYELAYDSYH